MLQELAHPISLSSATVIVGRCNFGKSADVWRATKQSSFRSKQLDCSAAAFRDDEYARFSQ
jgi:hypothetical protein